ncbi:uncharacterized protein TM35_000073730 [Trypanosoma theileri]|uniref:Palmitoyltransferase n=1 Tax=Trypanosoma theileri TaxID=67003 RepID=A0A1X0P316_9TRYP|nr:uncharacterized protein TM35_000073730 [Trypanosoma theileri]ORC90949.1 hypothetical protein TM35_000073730 [Trypanosoma theileri]
MSGDAIPPLPKSSNPLVERNLVETSETLTDSRKSFGEGVEFSHVISTAEDYWEYCRKLDQLRCHLGEPLSPEAAELYGPTSICSNRIWLLFKWRNKKYGTVLHEPKETTVMLGPGWPMLLFNLFLLLLASVLFTASYKDEGFWEFHVVVWVLGLITVVLMFWVAMRNPGIVPRRQKKGLTTRNYVRVRVPVPMFKKLQEKNKAMSKKEEGPEMGVENVNTTEVTGIIPGWFFDDKKVTIKECNVDLNTPFVLCNSEKEKEEEGMMEMNLIYCRTCNIYRAPRTHHCSVCDCCIDELDHHCAWLGCCVGKNNYHIFFAAIISLHVMILCVLWFHFVNNLLYFLRHPYLTPHQLLKRVYYLPIVTLAISFVLGIFFSGLTVVHIYVQLKGITTVEMLGNKFKKKPFWGISPWSLGSKWKNMKYRLTPHTLPTFHSEVYYPVMVAALIEDRKLDILMQLPKEERERVKKKMQSDDNEEKISKGKE